MEKIMVKNTFVEIDGDEMTRIVWKMLKERMLDPFLDYHTEYYDLGLLNREATGDQVTADAAHAIRKHGVGVKCATITPNDQRMTEYKLTQCWKSPNATLRGILDGTVFRKPIMVSNIKPAVRTWKKPITVGRHAYGDVYKNQEMKVPGPGRAEIVFTPANGEPVRGTIHEFTGPGIIQGMHNTEKSIRSFARACMNYALAEKTDLWFSTKDTISKTYDGFFKAVFEEEFADFKGRFDEAGITYYYTLIDALVASIVKSEGGMLWACKNYDGDVMSDLVASAYGSLAMMTSVLVSPEGHFEYEAAHGTVTDQYYQHLKGEETSTNSIALIYAWTGCLRKRGEMDGTPKVVAFADKLEAAARETIESGTMTGDLIAIVDPNPANRKVNTEEFIDAVTENLVKKI